MLACRWAPGRRHRHGADQGGPRLRRAVRHPGRRGSPRRHGLQGGRHRAGRHRLQMDIKITSITPEIMQVALEQARDGRLHILGEMAKAITGARGDVAATAPRITIINVPKEKIREVIGTGGKVIREIVEQTSARSTSTTTARSRSPPTDIDPGAAGDRLDPRHRRGAGDRRDLQRQGGEDRRFRRVRELPGLQGRAGAYQRVAAGPGREDHRRGQRGRSR